MTARLLRPSEVAQILDVPEGTLSNWRYERKGPEYVKIGRSVRYPEDKLNRFLDRHTVKPTRTAS